MTSADYGKPIKIFYANLLAVGLLISVDSDSGKLIVDGNVDILSPVYRDEIIKRKAHLVKMLTPAPPTELEPYFGRLLKLDELGEALHEAERIAVQVDSVPVNGGWLLTTKKLI